MASPSEVQMDAGTKLSPPPSRKLSTGRDVPLTASLAALPPVGIPGMVTTKCKRSTKAKVLFLLDISARELSSKF